jgi:polynucleotide 5'-hydroxyl-kinase GRC3/NOL9
MKPEPGWALALERAAASRVTVVLGDTDSGKTSLTTFLAGELAAAGRRVGVVDADLGQSQIGPPTTLGLGRVTAPVTRLAEAAVLALAWVGSTSPPGVERALWAGTRELVERARALDLGPILVDTCGLVRGELGRVVKAGEIAQADPDLVVCLSRGTECEAILAGVATRAGIDVMVLPVGVAVRRRSADERRRYREDALEAYFSEATAREVALDRVDPTTSELEDRLVGLFDETGRTLGIGRVAGVDRVAGRLLVETPVAHSPIARVVPGREKLESMRISHLREPEVTA